MGEGCGERGAFRKADLGDDGRSAHDRVQSVGFGTDDEGDVGKAPL